MHKCLACGKKCNCYVSKLSVCTNKCKENINPKYKKVVKVCSEQARR